jgi:hypothetical protein
VLLQVSCLTTDVADTTSGISVISVISGISVISVISVIARTTEACQRAYRLRMTLEGSEAGSRADIPAHDGGIVAARK